MLLHLHDTHTRLLQANPRGSGGTAAETKEKYTLKSAGGGTYNIAGGTQIAVSSIPNNPWPDTKHWQHKGNVFPAECTH